MVALFAVLACFPLPAFAQGTIIPFVSQAFYDSNGNPLSSGKLCTYAAGTTTAQSTYSDVTLTTPNANPIVLTSSGRPSTGAIFLSPTSYKFVLLSAGSDGTCNTGTTQWTLDNVSAVPTASGNVDVTGTAGETLALGDIVYLSDGSGGNTAGRFYKADADFAYASSNASIVGVATAAITSASSGSIRVGGRMTGLSALSAGLTYYVSATAGTLTSTAPNNARIVGAADTTTTLLLSPNPYVPPVPLVAEGRLTATSGTAVTTSDVSAATSIYYTPTREGNRIALYDGSALWNVRTFTEITISLSGCTASKPYDVFLYDNAGTVTAETLVWTNATTRATALTLQNGVPVKTGATTRRYVGSFYCNSTGGQTDDTEKKRYIYNAYNRALRQVRVIDTTDSWTYTTNAFRQANNSTANQIEVMQGLAEEPISLNLQGLSAGSNVGATPTVAIGEDSTTTVATNCVRAYAAVQVNNNPLPLIAFLSTTPAVGLHFYAWLENGSGAVGMTWYGDAGATIVQTGMVGTWRN